MKLKYIFILLFFIVEDLISQKTVYNYFNVLNYDEESAKDYFENSDCDVIEGIWQSSDGLKYSIERDIQNNIRLDNKYRIIVLSNNTNNQYWRESYIKGFIEKSAAESIFNIDYYTAGPGIDKYVEISLQNCIGVLKTDALFSFTKHDGEEILLLKLFPNGNTFKPKIPSIKKVSTGTGFAISSNGYIVTNNHVVSGANTIEISGVNGNLKRKLKAVVVVTDEKSDLAILKISDLDFAIGDIPYILRKGNADVGEAVFVLGYPLTSSMGDEVKLTNGIISSKTGFMGDFSAYQISAPIQPGNSGGPLFDNNGNVIGIVYAKHTDAQNASYAIKVNNLINLIETTQEDIVLSTSSELIGKSLTEQIKVISKYVYYIIVNDSDNSLNADNYVKKDREDVSGIENTTVFIPSIIDIQEIFKEINILLANNSLNEELINKIILALYLEPDNVSVINTLGNIFDKKAANSFNKSDFLQAEKSFKNAISCYKRALKIDPMNNFANYSIGTLYYNKAASYVNQMQSVSDDMSSSGMKKYNGYEKQMFAMFDLALPYFLKAEAGDPKDKNTLIALREIYARKNQIDKATEYAKKIEEK